MEPFFESGKRPWEEKGYEARLQELRDDNVLDLGMIQKDGSFHYSPFNSKSLDKYYFDFVNKMVCLGIC